MLFNPVKFTSRKQTFGKILAFSAFIFNSVDLFLIPWSKEGQHSYPYRYSSVIWLKYTLLLMMYSSFLLFSIILQNIFPTNISKRVTLEVDEIALRAILHDNHSLDTGESSGEESEDELMIGLGLGEEQRSNIAMISKDMNSNSSNDRNICCICCYRMKHSFLNGSPFIFNGLMILMIEICIFNILDYIPAATFAIIRNLVIPCTALIRGIWFKERPSGIQWLALIGITSAASSFASQESNNLWMNDYSHLSEHSSISMNKIWFWMCILFMLFFITLESVNIVFMEIKLKTTANYMRFTEQQFWITFYCSVLTFIFWIVDNCIIHQYSIFYGFSFKTVFLLFWRVLHAIMIFWMVRYLTSVVAMLVHTTASLGTSILDWMLMGIVLTSGQWFDALSVAVLALIYKIAPFDKHVPRPFEILNFVDDEEDDDDEDTGHVTL